MTDMPFTRMTSTNGDNLLSSADEWSDELQDPKRKKDYLKLMFHNPALFGHIAIPQLTFYKNNAGFRDGKFQAPCIAHNNIYDAIYRKPKRIAIICPRGISKTSIASTIGTCYDIAYDREDVIILIKKTYIQAIKDFWAIKSIIKHGERFRWFFGKFQIIKDRENEFYIRSPATGHYTYLMCVGAGQDITGTVFGGKRPTKILADDFESQDNTATSEQRTKVRNWLTGTVIPCLNPHKGHLVAIGTPKHYDSWLWRVYQGWVRAKKETSSYSWEVIYHQLEEGGKSIWPEMFPPKVIASLKQEAAEGHQMHMYWQERQCQPIDISNLEFKQEYLNPFKGILSFSFDNGHVLTIGDKAIPVYVVASLDPAMGKEKGKMPAFIVLCADHENNLYITKADYLKKQPAQLVDTMFTSYQQIRPDKMVVEKVGMQEVLADWMRQERINRDIWIPIVKQPVPTNISKDDKLRGMQPRFESGTVHVLETLVDLQEELLTFPNSKYKDLMDALWLAMQKIRRCSHKETRPVKQKGKFKQKLYDWRTL